MYIYLQRNLTDISDDDKFGYCKDNKTHRYMIYQVLSALCTIIYKQQSISYLHSHYHFIMINVLLYFKMDK